MPHYLSVLEIIHNLFLLYGMTNFVKITRTQVYRLWVRTQYRNFLNYFRRLLIIGRKKQVAKQEEYPMSQVQSTVLPRCFQPGWVPRRGFSFRAMMWIYASVITWCLVHLIPKYKALDCWLPTPKVGWVFCSWFWVLRLSSSAGLLNVPDISKCCERARLDNKRQKFRRSHPTI